MKHLYTITGNLLAETTATYPSVSPKGTHRAVAESFQVGGKGINVAKMAQRLGIFSTAICFPGGHTGDRCIAWLNTQKFGVDLFRQTAETRSGWVVRDSEGCETTFLGCDRQLEEEPWLAAISYLRHELKNGDTLTICGSIPGWRTELANPLGGLLDEIAGEVFVAVDTYGPPLTDLLRHPIDLVKINRAEFEGALKADMKDHDPREALVQFAREHPNVKRWVITAGSDPVLGLEEGGHPFEAKPPLVEVVSPVGCGDVLLAGLLHGLAHGNPSLAEALQEALPLAAANAASPGIADFAL